MSTAQATPEVAVPLELLDELAVAAHIGYINACDTAAHCGPTVTDATRRAWVRAHDELITTCEAPPTPQERDAGQRLLPVTEALRDVVYHTLIEPEDGITAEEIVARAPVLAQLLALRPALDLGPEAVTA